MNAQEVEELVKSVRVLGKPLRGGQKLVFPCEINGKVNALKLISIPINDSCLDEVNLNTPNTSEILSRIQREVNILKECYSPYIIKMGELDVVKTEVDGKPILYFSEEWIDGNDLKVIIGRGRIPHNEVLILCLHMVNAIEELWNHKKIHRDIKPGNIMYDSKRESYILLDMGFAFDAEDLSLTSYGLIPGTLPYLSPDQLDYENKRKLDFRSDIFSLGVVAYEAITGTHPFWNRGETKDQIRNKILNYNPVHPSEMYEEIPRDVGDTILRMMSKNPHRRYRKCNFLTEELNDLLEGE